MDAVVQVEETLRVHLRPAKINLAALGNAVPHLHWHVVARFEWDSHFPAAVWAAAQREAPPDRLAAIERLRPALEEDLAKKLDKGPGICTGS
jgi:diadenosine tetraphosphate (Ap4A) HIT family hydrolase